MKLAILLVVLLAAGVAHADRAHGGRAPQQRGQLKQLLVQQFDRDGDGRLQGQERKQAAKALRRLANRLHHGKGKRGQHRRERLIRRFDRDGDGNLGPGELPPRIQQRLQRLDRDGDGWVHDNEMP